MDENKLERYQQLAFKQSEGTITKEEAFELSEWLNSDDGKSFEIKDPLVQNHSEHERRIWENINQQLNTRNTTSLFSFTFLKIGMAAAVFIIVATAGYYHTSLKKTSIKETIAVKSVNDALPGIEGAILTLADGRKIILDTLNNGIVAQQNGAKIVLQHGEVKYDATGLTDKTVANNTLSTPKGRNYQLVLPDGTRVWLNAASAITYPTVFDQHAREVSVQGEVYFEVTKDSKRPFRVSTPAMKVEVLGTHFNINCYNDEETASTTLLEGSVKVIGNNKQVILKPEQQSITAIAGGKITRVIDDVDIEDVMAWKNGTFQFSNTDLKSVMRQLSRWYDVDVIYEGAEPEKKFTGQIPKKARLSAVLQSLSFIGVKFRIEGKTMIVTR